MNEDLFDFGFTVVDENELEVVQKASLEVKTKDSEAQTAQDKLDKLFNTVTPLLNNLKANPEKDYIYWPNRIQKVEQFETYLQSIYNK